MWRAWGFFFPLLFCISLEALPFTKGTPFPHINFVCGSVEIDEKKEDLLLHLSDNFSLEWAENELLLEGEEVYIYFHKGDMGWKPIRLKGRGFFEGSYGTGELGRLFFLFKGTFFWEESSPHLVVESFSASEPLKVRLPAFSLTAQKMFVPLLFKEKVVLTGPVVCEGECLFEHGLSPSEKEPLLVLQRLEAPRFSLDLKARIFRAEALSGERVFLKDFTQKVEITAQRIDALQKGSLEELSFDIKGPVHMHSLKVEKK